ncbi:MAG: MFS transporter [Bacteroidales bacterium]|nr:MFS transporter [Bacteroidales bacterium]
MFKVNKILIKTLGLKSDEVNKFLLLFFHSFFIGLFLALYFVQANSVFIRDYGSEQLPYAYLLAGLVGYIISSLYSHFQQKVKSKYLFASALVFMLIIILFGRLAFGFVKPEYLSFFVFIWAWPFISLSGIESGGLALRLLNLVQVKRLFGLINMGGVIASILGYLLIPVLTKIIGTSYNLLFISIGSLIAALIILYYIYKKFPDEKNVLKVSRDQSKTNFRHLIKDKYFRLIFISASLSMTVIYITDFGFLSAIKVQEATLFSAAGSVASFMALVFAGLKIGELLISYFSSRILVRYGVKLGLIVLPLTITLIVLVSLFFGFTAGAASMVFLVLMTLNKSMERIVRRGLDDPAFNILYQPLPSNLQLAVQSKVGVVMQFAISIAGALLLGLSLLLNIGGGFSLEYFPVFFLPILIVWVYVARKLYFGYKNKLREILKELSQQRRHDTSRYRYGTEVLSKKFKKFNDYVVRLSVTMLAETNPRIFEPYISSLIKKDDELINKAILKSIDPTWRDRISKQIKTQFAEEKNTEVKDCAKQAVSLLNFSEISGLKESGLDKLDKSEDNKDKIKLIKYLVKNPDINNIEKYVVNLFKSEDQIIKNSAIRLAVGIKTNKLIVELLNLLKSSKYYHVSTAALLDIGEKALPFLKKMFKETDNEGVILKIIEIYAKMGSSSAKSLIVKQINYPSRKIQLAVIWALFYCKYQASEDEEKIIKDKILSVIDNLLRILTSIIDIKSEKNTLKLFLALDQERETNYEVLFNLLSFLHEPRIINLIKKNIIGKNTIYALELIDNFIQADLKPYIVPIFDDISTIQKIKKLSKYFPQQRLNFNDRLRYLITLDYDMISTWAVTRTLEMLERIHRKKSKKDTHSEKQTFDDIKLWTNENTTKILNRIKRSELPDEVFLSLFHSHELVYTTAAKIIFDENPQKCFEYLKNMSPEKQALIDVLSTNGVILQDKVKLLRRYQLFFSIPDFLLVELAEIMTVNVLSKGEKIFFNTNGNENILILIRGELKSDKNKGESLIFSKKIILTPGMNIDNKIEYLIASKKAIVLTTGRYDYFNLLVDNTKILQHIFDIIQD